MLGDILICPKTKGRIRIDAAHSVARAVQSNISYPIKGGIIDFLPNTVDRVSKAYDSFAASYDRYQTLSGLHWKLFSLIAWGACDYTDMIQKPLSSIPDDFDGILLDVPVGTGIFTVEKYCTLKKATIVAVDYSLAMLQKAQTRYTQHGIHNVLFIRADVANLPIQQASIDMCLSMAGFHAFHKKDDALHEIARVLKTASLFSGTTYIKGKRLLTDLIVTLIFSARGAFTGPFLNEQEWLLRFGKYFSIRCTGNVESGLYFEMKRNEANYQVLL